MKLILRNTHTHTHTHTKTRFPRFSGRRQTKRVATLSDADGDADWQRRLLRWPQCLGWRPTTFGFTSFSLASFSRVGSNRLGPGFTGFYRVLMGFTGFYRVLMGFSGFYRVFPGYISVLVFFFRRFQCFLFIKWCSLGCIEFKCVLVGFTGFYKFSEVEWGFLSMFCVFNQLIKLQLVVNPVP